MDYTIASCAFCSKKEGCEVFKDFNDFHFKHGYGVDGVLSNSGGWSGRRWLASICSEYAPIPHTESTQTTKIAEWRRTAEDEYLRLLVGSSM